MSSLPRPRGPLTERLFAALRKPPHALDPLSGAIDYEDLQLALYCCYELHYRGFAGVDDRWEWEPSLLALRAQLEERFEADLHELAGPPGEPPQPAAGAPPQPAEVDVLLRELMLADDAPSVSTYVEREATNEQVLEFMIHRTPY